MREESLFRGQERERTGWTKALKTGRKGGGVMSLKREEEKEEGRNRRNGLRRAPGEIGSEVASSPSGICPRLRENARTRVRTAGPWSHPGQYVPTRAKSCDRWVSRASNGCLCVETHVRLELWNLLNVALFVHFLPLLFLFFF